MKIISFKFTDKEKKKQIEEYVKKGYTLTIKLGIGNSENIAILKRSDEK